MAAKEKYAGLKGDIGAAPWRIEIGVRRVVSLPCPVGAGEALGAEKGCCREDSRTPFASSS